MADVRVPTACEQCGGYDDHPKLHYGEQTFHHDCLSVKVEREIAEHPVVPQIIAAAKAGIRGPQLLAHIAELHADPEPAPAVEAPAPAAAVAEVPAAPAAPGLPGVPGLPGF